MRLVKIGICINFVAFILACNQPHYSPKPRGYFRIAFPEKQYQTFSSTAPFEFEYPVYANMYPDSSKNAQPYWYNLTFPAFNARLHISYYSIGSPQEFIQLTEDSRKLAFKHTVKATGIDEALITNKQDKVYGIYYTISGNTASSSQFFLTDSSQHYLRAALYFNEKPQQDSIQPVIDFIKKDMDKMIKTFKWK